MRVPTALTYPPAWKFESSGDEVPDQVVRETFGYAEKIAKTAPDEKYVVEVFKSRFGDSNSSSSVGFVYGDLDTALQAAKENGAVFAESLWMAVSDLRDERMVVPTSDQINAMFAKHGFQYAIRPPNLVRVGTPKVTKAAPSAAPVPIPRQVSVPLAEPKQPRTCFVAQPFHEPFQTRFKEDVMPAISAAGLVAYKVDGDPAADKLIEDIENGIRESTVVLVDITEDNPNVWYELGFSQALRKPLVMISCSTTRGPERPYPFDVRGRRVINYTTGTRSAHDQLQRDITERIGGILKRLNEQPPPAQPPMPSPAASIPMDKRTLSTFMAILSASAGPDDPASMDSISRWMLRLGYQAMDWSIGIRLLVQMRLVDRRSATDDFGNPYPVFVLSDAGETFVVEHHHLLPTMSPSQATPSRDEDIPF